jgi:RNA polymerase sigma-70 factor, ECF subfamily
MASESSFADLMARLRAGDEGAAAEVFARYAHRLIALARGRLDSRLRQKVDPEDVVQSVWRSFFTRYADGQFDLATEGNLWGMLAVITARKCGRKVAQFHGPHRDVRKEVPPPLVSEGADAGWAAYARDPTPHEAAVLADTLEHFMRELSEQERRTLELHLQGYTAAEIGADLGRSEYTVRWALKRIRKRLRHLRDADAANAG